MRMTNRILILLLSMLLFSNLCLAKRVAPDSVTSDAPYFFVPSAGEESLERLPLKRMSVDGHIAGMIADMTIEQTFENKGKTPIEAVYTFPASTKAAVYAVEMRIGERIVRAKIDELKKAQEKYQAAKDEGKTASLLQQHKPNVFQMNVANIMPGDVIKVKLQYTEMIVPTDRIYEMVIPTVVGPRFTDGETKLAAKQWASNPYLKDGAKAPYEFSAKLKISSPIPVASVKSPSHNPKIDFVDQKTVNVHLKPGAGGNKDLVVRYKLAGDQVATGTLLFEGKDENFFLTMIQPPERVKTKALVDREYIFVVDVSGSMNGFPLNTSKELMRDLLGNLNEGDYFNMLFFAGGNQVFSPQSVPASEANIRKAIQFLDNQRGGGGTNLLPALRQALAMPRSSAESRSFVIATDGYVAVEEEAFDLIRAKLGQANFFSFGIGSSVNRHLIDGIARAGVGEPFVILGPQEAQSTSKKFRRYIDRPLLANINVEFDGLQAYSVEPMRQPDLFADRPVIVFGKYSGKAKGQVKITGKAADGEFSAVVNLSKVKPEASNSGLRYLWARNRIADLAFKDSIGAVEGTKEEITKLGLQYNLLTKYTAFMAIDNQVRNKNGSLSTVKQPLPLPEGVSGNALAGGALRFRSAPMSKSYGLGRGGSGGLSTAFRASRPQGEAVADSDSAAKPQPTKLEFEEHKNSQLAMKKTSLISELYTKGGLSEAVVRRRLQLDEAGIRQCLAGPTTQIRKLQLRFVVNAKGRAERLKIVGRAGFQGNAKLESCLLQKVRQIDFTKSQKPTRVALSFVW